MNAVAIPLLAEATGVFLVPTVAIVMSLLIPILAIVSDAKKKRAIYELHHRERLAAIEKGMEIPPLPPELLNGSHHARGPRNGLLPGLIWSAVGIGMLIAMQDMDVEVTKLGFIPLLVGIAYLAYYLLEGRRLAAEARKAESLPPAPAQP